jgi:hypothetical protein
MKKKKRKSKREIHVHVVYNHPQYTTNHLMTICRRYMDLKLQIQVTRTS